MTRDEAKQKLDLAKSGAFGQDRRHQMFKVIDQIYDAHEAELKAKDKCIEEYKQLIEIYKTENAPLVARIAELEMGAKNSAGIYARQLADKDKKIAELEDNAECNKYSVDDRDEEIEEQKLKIAELEAMVQKMKCCENCERSFLVYDGRDCNIRECHNLSHWQLKDTK